MMFTWHWQKAALERAVKSSAQMIVLTAGTAIPGWMQMQWNILAYAAVGGFVLSYLTSIITTPFGPDKDDPSLV